MDISKECAQLLSGVSAKIQPKEAAGVGAVKGKIKKAVRAGAAKGTGGAEAAAKTAEDKGKLKRLSCGNKAAIPKVCTAEYTLWLASTGWPFDWLMGL